MDLRTPVLKGLQRPDVYLGVDLRVLVAVVILLLAGTKFPLLWLVAIGFYFGGRLLASYSPFLISDSMRYMRWRSQAWWGVIPDEGALEASRTYTMGERKW